MNRYSHHHQEENIYDLNVESVDTNYQRKENYSSKNMVIHHKVTHVLYV